MSIEFVELSTLDQDITFTVKSMQYLNGSTGYFYVIRITKPDGSVYYMNIRIGSLEQTIYDKLEEIRLAWYSKQTIYFYKNACTSLANCDCAIRSREWS